MEYVFGLIAFTIIGITIYMVIKENNEKTPAKFPSPQQPSLPEASVKPHLIDCPACGANISNQAPICPHCGHPMDISHSEECPIKGLGNQQSHDNQKVGEFHTEELKMNDQIVDNYPKDKVHAKPLRKTTHWINYIKLLRYHWKILSAITIVFCLIIFIKYYTSADKTLSRNQKRIEKYMAQFEDSKLLTEPYFALGAKCYILANNTIYWYDPQKKTEGIYVEIPETIQCENKIQSVFGKNLSVSYCGNTGQNYLIQKYSEQTGISQWIICRGAQSFIYLAEGDIVSKSPICIRTMGKFKEGGSYKRIDEFDNNTGKNTKNVCLCRAGRDQ